jgi:hypothetical protein
MRPLFHPSVDNITVEGILHALSDPVRVHIFAEIALVTLCDVERGRAERFPCRWTFGGVDRREMSWLLEVVLSLSPGPPAV